MEGGQRDARIVHRSCYKTMGGPSGALKGRGLERNENATRGDREKVQPICEYAKLVAPALGAGNDGLFTD